MTGCSTCGDHGPIYRSQKAAKAALKAHGFKPEVGSNYDWVDGSGCRLAIYRYDKGYFVASSAAVVSCTIH